MKALITSLLIAMFIISGHLYSQEFNKKVYYSSEAVRFAWDACKRDKSEKACELYERLVQYHKTKPKEKVVEKAAEVKKEEPKRAPASVKIAKEDDYKLKIVEVDKRQKAQVAAPPKEPGCEVLPEKIKTCSPFECKYIHPKTGNIVKRRIIGRENGKCVTKDDLPDKGYLNCKHENDALPILEKFYATNGEDFHGLRYINKSIDGQTCIIEGR